MDEVIESFGSMLTLLLLPLTALIEAIRAFASVMGWESVR